jgi:flagellar basal body-associated protein FliL
MQPHKQKGMSTPAMIFFTVLVVGIMAAVWLFLKKEQAASARDQGGESSGGALPDQPE